MTISGPHDIVNADLPEACKGESVNLLMIGILRITYAVVSG